MTSGLRRAVFLDRDGVLIEDRQSYVRRWEDVEIFSSAIRGCKQLTAAGFALVVVTNQALVGRGLLSLKEVEDINKRILDHFSAEGAPILAAYLCPHHPDDGCDCRKPKPGMLFTAAQKNGLDLDASYLIGDAVRDIEAANSAGVSAALVRTGKGREQEAFLAGSDARVWGVFENLEEAAAAILYDRSGDNRPCS